MKCTSLRNSLNEFEVFNQNKNFIGHCYLDKKLEFWVYEGKTDEREYISQLLNTLNSQIIIPSEYYVYLVYVDQKLKYIGKGFGNRYQHTVSGVSHVFGLNKAYFAGQTIEVVLYADGLSESNALNLESSLISLWYCKDKCKLFNSKGINLQPTACPQDTEQELF